MSLLARLLCAAAAALFATTAAATPVTVGSTYNLFLASAAWDRSVVTGLVFDGIAEAHVRSTTDNAGQTREIGFSVGESQQALGDGRHRIFIDVIGAGDLYPFNRLVGFGFGNVADDPLDLAIPVRLLANVVSVFAGNDELASGDWVESTRTLGQANPWDGYFIRPGTFGAFVDLTGRGIDRVRFSMLVQEIPTPASLALVLLALPLAFVPRAGRRADPRWMRAPIRRA
jgi:hypothetical protein